MIPAILGALKAATWAQRGIAVGILVGVGLALFLTGYYKGAKACNEKHAEVALQQAIDAKEHEAVKAYALDQVTERHEARSRALDAPTETITREIDRYVERTRPITLEPEYRRLVDQLHRLQRNAANRVSGTHETPREVDELSAEGLTSSQLLLAYKDLANARQEDLGIIAYCKDFERTRYKTESAFYDQE